jgi:hypothetical protein
MRPRTKLPIPEPTGSEFHNFDRLMKILITKKSRTAKVQPAKSQRRRRLPRP